MAQSIDDLNESDVERLIRTVTEEIPKGKRAFILLAVSVIALLVVDALPLLVFEIPPGFILAVAALALFVGAFASDSIID